MVCITKNVFYVDPKNPTPISGFLRTSNRRTFPGLAFSLYMDIDEPWWTIFHITKSHMEYFFSCHGQKLRRGPTRESHHIPCFDMFWLWCTSKHKRQWRNVFDTEVLQAFGNTSILIQKNPPCKNHFPMNKMMVNWFENKRVRYFSEKSISESARVSDPGWFHSWFTKNFQGLDLCSCWFRQHLRPTEESAAPFSGRGVLSYDDRPGTQQRVVKQNITKWNPRINYQQFTTSICCHFLRTTLGHTKSSQNSVGIPKAKTQWTKLGDIPSGKQTYCYWKWPLK